MISFFDDVQRGHDPTFFFSPGSPPTFALSWAATFKPFCQLGEARDAG